MLLRRVALYALAFSVFMLPAIAQPIIVQQPTNANENFVPEGTVSVEGGSSATVIAPIHRGPFVAPPDLPLPPDAFKEPLSVKFTFDHRGALNGKNISVTGIAVSVLLPKDACPQNDKTNENPMRLRPMMACAQPRIMIADTKDPARDSSRDMMVHLHADDKTEYVVGQKYVVRGLVSASPMGVSMQKAE